MVTLINPAGVQAMGNINVVIVPAATITGPTLAQITASGALDITQMLYAGGWTPQSTANVVTAPRRLGDVRIFNRFGLVTDSLGNIRYVYQPQALTSADGKKAYTLLAPGASLFAVERLGVAESTAFAISDWVRVAPVIPGPYNPVYDTTDEASEFAIDQQIVIPSPGWGAFVQIPS